MYKSKGKMYKVKSCGKAHPYCGVCRPDVAFKMSRGRLSAKYINIKTEMGWQSRSHAVMEQKIGRSIAHGEIVHHINGHTRDDDPSNLQLFANKGAHSA
jgi:hypothetical protein